MHNAEIIRAAEVVGSQRALAEAIGVTPGAVSQWAIGLHAVPVERAVQIERATRGTVTRRDLRPDDWWLIWPELINGDHPAPLPASNGQEAA